MGCLYLSEPKRSKSHTHSTNSVCLATSYSRKEPAKIGARTKDQGTRRQRRQRVMSVVAACRCVESQRNRARSDDMLHKRAHKRGAAPWPVIGQHYRRAGAFLQMDFTLREVGKRSEAHREGLSICMTDVLLGKGAFPPSVRKIMTAFETDSL